jgi:type IV secretion system protein VirD4
MFMLAQDITQVEEIYGDKQTIDSGASTRIVYAPNKIETAEKLARMTGKTTIEEEKNSNSRDMIGIKPGSISTNMEKIGRDLMTADEFMSLHDQDMVVFVKGQPPIYGRKAFYYENPVMLGRAKMPPPKRSVVLRKAKSDDVPVVEEKTSFEVASEASDKWAASRNALKARLHNVLSDKKDSPPKESMTDGSATAKHRSRYTEQGAQVSTDEMQQVQALVKNVALVDKVAKLTAFNH